MLQKNNLDDINEIICLQVEGKVSAIAVDPLEVVPPHLYVAWTDTMQ